MSVRCLSPMFVLMFVLIGAVSGATDLKRKVGDEVSFKPIPTLSPGNTITWKFKAEARSVIRVIELDYGESASPQNPLFKENAAADINTGELTLKDVRKDHSGLYYFDLNGKEQEQKFTLMVMGVVLKPKINQEKSSNHHFVYLTCEYNKTINEKAKMSWNCSNVKQNQTKDSFTYSKTGKADSCCTCTLKNDVSEETSDQICETEMFPGVSNTVQIVLWSIFAIILILIVLIVLLFLYLYNNRVHNWIHSNCKDKPCLGGMVERLEGLRSKKDRQREEEDKSKSEPLKETDKGAGDEGPGDKCPGDESFVRKLSDSDHSVL